MNIAIVGAGNVGRGLGTVLAEKHTVIFASRDIDAAESAAVAAGPRAIFDRVPEAIRQADVVVLAVPYASVGEVIKSAPLSSKVVVDVTNPLTDDYSGLTVGFETSAAEEIQKQLVGTPVVKAFNTVFAQIYAHGTELGNRRVQVFCASDDDAARATVIKLAADAGFEPVDAGELKNARFIEPLAALNIQLGYAMGHGTQIAPVWITRTAA
ncbi:MAG: NADPH-dependent F420 reductase [Pseudomonadota bacterium]